MSINDLIVFSDNTGTHNRNHSSVLLHEHANSSEAAYYASWQHSYWQVSANGGNAWNPAY